MTVKITLTQKDIEAACRCYVANKRLNLVVRDVKLITHGAGGAVTAEVSCEEQPEPQDAFGR